MIRRDSQDSDECLDVDRHNRRTAHSITIMTNTCFIGGNNDDDIFYNKMILVIVPTTPFLKSQLPFHVPFSFDSPLLGYIVFITFLHGSTAKERRKPACIQKREPEMLPNACMGKKQRHKNTLQTLKPKP